ncbi:MAG: HAMP domain-containing protein, partial [Actinomycetota bacterium]
MVAAEASSAARSSIVFAAVLLLATVALGGATLISLVTQLRSLAKAASRIAEGDLSLEPIPVASRDDLGQVASAFNTMTESLVELIGGLQRSSAALLSSSTELNGVSSTIATSVHDTSERVETTREASGEMALEVSSIPLISSMTSPTSVLVAPSSSMVPEVRSMICTASSVTARPRLVLLAISSIVWYISSTAAATEDTSSAISPD